MDENNPDRLVAIVLGYQGFRLFKTENSGEEWVDFTESLAGLQLSHAVIQKVNSIPTLFLGTSNGIYRRSLNTWEGTITNNTTWSGQVLVIGNVTVATGAALTIQPNTTVKFFNGTQLSVDGALVANGTAQSPVTFTVLNLGETWSGITSGASPPTISLSYANISNAYTALNVGSYTNLTVDRCNISNCNIGINIFPTAHSPIPTMQITNNTFSGFPLACTGIAIDKYSDVLIANNTLTGPVVKGTGIYLNESSPRMVGNTIQSFKFGLVCLSGSAAMLEDVEGPGNNMIMNNINAVWCDMSHAILGGDFGGNSICMNSYLDVYVAGGSKVVATNDSWASNCELGYPPGTFVIIDGELTYEPCAGSCGGASPIAGGKHEQGLDGGEPMMTPAPALVMQALRERRRGNHAQTDALLRSIVSNGSITQQWRRWALGQLLAVGQRLRSGNLASYFNTIAASQPALGRHARGLLPASFISDGSFANAMTAYDANIRQYPNSSEARAGLYGKFTYQLYNRHDTTQARSLLNQLIGGYPQSREAEIAELQMSVFRSSTVLNRVNGGAGTLANALTSLSPTLLPKEFELSQNYPNPFNPTTTIDFALPKDAHVSLKLYDILGREVKSLVNEPMMAGYHQATVDGSSLATGVYLYRMTAGNYVASKKLILMK